MSFSSAAFRWVIYYDADLNFKPIPTVHQSLASKRHMFLPALCHVLFTFSFCFLYIKGELRGKRGEITRRGFFEEGNFRRGIFGGESSRRVICVKGNLRGGE